ncbi:MAG: DNA primase [Chloroflexi bacterium]|nr:DNA primase [Chloroflexota bacterium]
MSVVEEVRQRLDIVEVVSSYVALQRSGRSYKARCPFHEERTPSFFVFPERQSWRCFGACASGGDVFNFVMRVDNLSFGKALEVLAQRAGVALTRERRGDQDVLDPLYQANAAARDFYHEQLLHSPEGQAALRYVEGRGVTQQSIVVFQLGYSPRSRDALLRHLAALGITEDTVAKAGLLYRSEDGRARDLFHGRLMFPIHDARGRPVGLGGRSLDGSEPKYLNSPRTPIFDKGSLLYGLHLAADAMRRQGEAVIVEGYMDALVLHQFEFCNVVASMGTALTESQVAQVRGLASRFVLALDPDVAGQEATLRSLEGSWRLFERLPLVQRPTSGVTLFRRPAALSLRVAALPPGQDPDELVRQDPGLWRKAVEEAVPVVEFILTAAGRRFDLSSPEGKADAARTLLPLVYAVGDTFEQDRYFRRLAELLGVRPELLAARVGSPTPSRSGRRAQPSAPAPEAFVQASGDPLEEYVLAILVQYPVLRPAAAALAEDHFGHSENRQLFSALAASDKLDMLKSILPEALTEHLEALTRYELPPPTDLQARQQALVSAVRRLQERHLRDLKLQEEATLAGDVAGKEPSLDINQQLHRLFQEMAESGRGTG